MTKTEATEKVAEMLVRDYPGKFVRQAQLGGEGPARAKEPPPKQTESRRAPEPEQDSAPEPESDIDTGVPDSPPEEDVADSSPETEPKPKERDDKDRNFAQLRKQLKEERSRRESIERELLTERQRKDKEQRKTVIDAVLAAGQRPADFDSLSKEQQADWTSAQAAMAQLNEHVGEGAVNVLKRAILELEILKQVQVPGGLSDAQIESLSGILVSSAGLSPQEALLIAKARDPSLFPESASVEPPAKAEMPAGHRVQEPSRSGRRRAPESKDEALVAAVNNAETQLGRKRAVAALIGERFGIRDLIRR